MGKKPEKTGENKDWGLEVGRRMKSIREAMGTAAIFTIGMRKNNKCDIFEVRAGHPTDETPDQEGVEDEGAGQMPRADPLKKQLRYIG